MSEKPKRRLMYNRPDGEVISGNYNADAMDKWLKALRDETDAEVLILRGYLGRLLDMANTEEKWDVVFVEEAQDYFDGMTEELDAKEASDG